jgi:hypothetical protein
MPVRSDPRGANRDELAVRRGETAKSLPQCKAVPTKVGVPLEAPPQGESQINGCRQYFFGNFDTEFGL